MIDRRININGIYFQRVNLYGFKGMFIISWVLNPEPSSHLRECYEASTEFTMVVAKWHVRRTSGAPKALAVALSFCCSTSPRVRSPWLAARAKKPIHDGSQKNELNGYVEKQDTGKHDWAVFLFLAFYKPLKSNSVFCK
jgi:hypothetical protein